MHIGGQSFGQWLGQRRKAHDLTQKELAQRVGCAVVTISKIEADERRPSKQISEQLAAHLGVPPEEKQEFIRFARTGLPGWHSSRLSRSRSAARQEAVRAGQVLSYLPAQLTPLIGRAPDTAAVQKLLLADEVRLLTLTGPPGVGKTGLGLQAAAGLVENFEDGVFCVSLARLTDADLVIPSIVEALGLEGTGSRQPLSTLVAYLQDKHVLLLLDNFEQVSEAATTIAGLLAACRRLKVLVTSRSSLHLRGEQQYRVSPLAFPPAISLPATDLLSKYPALTLFVERVRARNPDFALTDENVSKVAAICARLDGLPLAIELAAGRVSPLSPPALLEQLSGGRPAQRLLRDGPRDVPRRQRSLREAIDWSYNLLETSEQRLFARLAVFVGGCTLEAAVAVCVDEEPRRGEAINPDQPAREDAVLDGLTSLLDKSLLTEVQRGRENSDAWFEMLQTIHDYAQERLAHSGEVDETRRRHTAYYRALAEAGEPFLMTQGQSRWLERLQREHDNVKAALGWALKHGQAEAVARISAALWPFWWICGHLSEGRRWLEAALATGSSLPAPVLAKALNVAGVLARNQQDYSQSRALLEQSLELHRSWADRRGIAYSLNNLGLVALDQGDFGLADSLFEESLALFRDLGARRGIALSLYNQWLLAVRQDDSGRATMLYAECLPLLRDLGDRSGLILSVQPPGLVALGQGDAERTRLCYRESLVAEPDSRDREAIIWALEGLARVAEVQGRAVRAARLLGATEALRAAARVRHQPGDRAQSERTLTTVRAELHETDFAIAWAEGRAMSLEQATAYALADDQPDRTEH